MSQPTMPAPAHPAFCTACGGHLPGPVPRCPRCGAVIGAQGAKKRGGGATIAIVVVAVLLGGVCMVGVLAAIAIPNFLRYQLRSKEAAVKVDLEGLLRAEQAAFAQSGAYVPLDPLPASAPGTAKVALSPEEQALAAKLDWMIMPSTHGQYRVAVSTRADGMEAASLCAESDLDGDGVRGVHVAFLPFEDDGAPPPAPCTEPVAYDAGYGSGQVVKISAANVF